MTNSHDKVLLTSRKTASRPFSSISSDKFGINAAVKAPSPSSRRKRLGSVNAAVNAELRRLAPNTAVINISRNRPNTRDTMVNAETTHIRDIIFDIS